MTAEAKTKAKKTSVSGELDAHVYLVRGEDATLVAQEARSLVDRLVGDRDPGIVVEEHGGPAADGLDVAAIIDACTTPPFLVDRRVVVVRDAGRLTPADGARLSEVLATPLPTLFLVMVAGGGTVPQALVKTVSVVGEVIETTVGTYGARKGWLSEHLKAAPVRLDAAAGSLLASHLGDDLGRMSGILETLAAAYGEGVSIGVGELEPFLGVPGAVRPWDLTDAIDAGDVSGSLNALRRMMSSGGRGAPEVVEILHRHFSNMLRLDGAATSSADDAAAVLGVRSTFVAKKALAQCRKLGFERIGRAIVMLSDADLDIKGRTALPPETVTEVLVARLARLVPNHRGGRRR